MLVSAVLDPSAFDAELILMIFMRFMQRIFCGEFGEMEY